MVVVWIIYFVFLFPKTKFIGQAFLFIIPGVSDLLREVELARLGYVLGTLLQSGLPIVDALDSLRDSTAILRYEKFYRHLFINVEEGNSFQKSFGSYKGINGLIPPPLQQMIFSGEQSGKLAETLLVIGKTFEDKTETTSKDLTVVLEPIMLVIVWVAVMGVALAVILPIYTLIGSLHS